MYGLIQLIYAIRARQIAQFFKNIVVLIPAVLIAVGTFFGQFWAISEYTTYSIRGPSELVNKNIYVRQISRQKSINYSTNF